MSFRSTGHWENEYRFGLWSESASAYANHFYFVKYTNGTFINIAASGVPNLDGNVPSPFSIPTNSHVRIEAIGSLLRFYVNENQIFEFNDPDPHLTGQVGLGVIWNWTDGFDNVSVALVPEADVVWALLGVGITLAAARRVRGRRRQTKIGRPAN